MRITIKTGNAAFHDQAGHYHAGPECARILRRLADEIEQGGTPVCGTPVILMDYNGNKVGTCADGARR